MGKQQGDPQSSPLSVMEESCSWFEISRKQIHLQILLSYIVINGSQKTSTSKDSSNIKISYTNFRSTMKRFIKEEWQKLWPGCPNNKLYNIKPDRRLASNTKNMQRWSNNVQTSYQTLHDNTFLYSKKEPPPICMAWQELYIIKHILTNSWDFN